MLTEELRQELYSKDTKFVSTLLQQQNFVLNFSNFFQKCHLYLILMFKQLVCVFKLCLLSDDFVLKYEMKILWVLM